MAALQAASKRIFMGLDPAGFSTQDEFAERPTEKKIRYENIRVNLF